MSYTKSLGSLVEFRNCFVSPSILYALPNATTEDAKIARAFGMSTNVTASVGQNITSSITNCLQSYCWSDPGCRSYSDPESPLPHPCNQSSLTKNNITLEGIAVNTCMSIICANLTLTVNSDFAGIGVFLSYYLQIGIAIVGFLLLGLFSSWTYHVLRHILWIYRRQKAKVIAKRIQDRYRTHLPAVVTALVEFQKAQCFFMIAVQIAALVVTLRGSLGTKSLAELQLNYNLLQIIAAGGYLPITFNLICLRQYGKRSWYIFLLSLCTFGLSAATLFGTIELNPDGIVSSNPLEACGNRDLTSLCSLSILYGSSGSGYNENAASQNAASYNAFSFAASMMFLLTIDQFNLTIHQRVLQILMQLKAWCERIFEKGSKFIRWPRIKLVFLTTISETNRHLVTHAAYRRTLQTMTHAKIKVWCYIQQCFETIFGKYNRFVGWVKTKVKGFCSKDAHELFDAGLNLVEFISYLVVLKFYSEFFTAQFAGLQVFIGTGVIDTNNWGFGQIVGITLWAPVLFEYFYLEMRGMTRGSDYRPAHGFLVTKKTGAPPVLDGEEEQSHEMALLGASTKGAVSPPSYSPERTQEEQQVSFSVGPEEGATDARDRLLPREEDVEEAHAQHFV